MASEAKEACGIFGIVAPGEDVARITFFALYALQHRGQESAGIATSTGEERLHLRTGMGLLAQVFDESDLSLLPGEIAIGHTRYSTTGSSSEHNAQPIVVDTPIGQIAIAHNGNLVNARDLRDRLQARGYRFKTGTDSEAIAWLIADSPGQTFVDRLRSALPRLSGAYSLTLLTRDSLYAIRDPLGIRPLSLGRVGSGWAVASETCALDTIGVTVSRAVEPGEVVEIGLDGPRTIFRQPSPREALCVFEFIYFARPDSTINGKLLHLTRQNMGAQLAIEHPVDADLVIAVPDSATPAGIGYSRESGIPFSEGLIKNRYIGRTFIQPDQRLRDSGVMLKFNPLAEVLRGKRLVVVDDSIVRGTTTPRVVSLLRDAGATEIHLRICAPPIKHPCYYGVDMATRHELIAANLTVPEITKFSGADSLGYLSLEGLFRAIGLPRERFCTACLTGEYPVPVQLELDKFVLERC